MGLKSIFLGNNLPQLEKLIQHSDVQAIFIKDDPENFNFQSIKNLCSEKSIPIYMPKSMRKEKDDTAYNIIKDFSPDIIISGGYHLVVPGDIIDIPKNGTFNIHPAPLPEYRGQHVIQWQLINDEKNITETIHYMVPALDAGDVVKEDVMSIMEYDNAYTLWNKTSESGAKLLGELLLDISSGKNIIRRKQDESKAKYYHKRTREDGKIDWSKNAREIFNLSKALVNPWPGAYFEHTGNIYILNKTEYLNDNTSNPGKIFDKSDTYITVGTSDGQILINKENIRGYEGNFDEFIKGKYINK